jgi:hypothetical protein
MLAEALKISADSDPAPTQSSYLYSIFNWIASLNELRTTTSHGLYKSFIMNHTFVRRKLFVLLMILAAVTGFGQPGIAPVSTPVNGFKIDGFLQRQSADAGDWLAGPGGSEPGTFLLTNGGFPVSPFFGFVHSSDLWDSNDDDVFAANSKFSDNPNTMRWTRKRANPRNDINHGIAFATQNLDDGHIWVIVSGDRYATSGTDILDFEFLQNPVLKTEPGNNGQGGFFSSGPHNGRTVGDLVVSIQFSGEGSFGTTFISQWQPGAVDGEYAYFTVTPAAGTVYAAFNADPVTVPYGAFGSTTYPTLTFGEAAIDMTALIGGVSEGCNTTSPFRTLWIKSRSSSTANAQLQDFVDLVQIPYTIVGYSVSVSQTPLPGFSVQLTTLVSPGTVADYDFHWIELAGNLPGGTLSNTEIYNPVFSLTDPNACGNFSYEVEVRLKSTGCLVAKVPITIRIPCRIGKPINPDKANIAQSVIAESSIGKNDITVYPNPNKGTATITLPNDNNPRDIELIDMKGTVIQRWNQVSTRMIQFKNVSPGLYMLKVVTSVGRVTTKKIMIGR